MKRFDALASALVPLVKARNAILEGEIVVKDASGPSSHSRPASSAQICARRMAHSPVLDFLMGTRHLGAPAETTSSTKGLGYCSIHGVCAAYGITTHEAS